MQTLGIYVKHFFWVEGGKASTKPSLSLLLYTINVVCVPDNDDEARTVCLLSS